MSCERVTNDQFISKQVNKTNRIKMRKLVIILLNWFMILSVKNNGVMDGVMYHDLTEYSSHALAEAVDE